MADHKSYAYDDESGHVLQVTQIGEVAVANTHIKWAPEDDHNHIELARRASFLVLLEINRPQLFLPIAMADPEAVYKQWLSKLDLRI